MPDLSRQSEPSPFRSLLITSAGSALFVIWSIHQSSMFPLIWSDLGAATVGTLLGSAAATGLAFGLQLGRARYAAAVLSAAVASAVLAGTVYGAHLDARSPILQVCYW